MFIDSRSAVPTRIKVDDMNDSTFHGNGYVIYNPSMDKYLDLSAIDKSCQWYNGTVTVFDDIHIEAILTEYPCNFKYDNNIAYPNLLSNICDHLKNDPYAIFIYCKIYTRFRSSGYSIGFVPDFTNKLNFSIY